MVVDGVELIKMIKDKVFKKGNKIKSLNKGTSYDGEDIEFIWTDENDYKKFAEMSFWTTDELSLLNDFDIEFVIGHNFEIILEEDEEIDIQAIEELDEECYFINELAYYRGTGEYEVVKQQNKIIKAIKYLDKKIK